MRAFVLILGLAVLVLGVAGLLVGGFAGEQVIEEIERSFALAPGQEIFVQSLNGPITYESWDGSEVVIRAVKESRGLFPALGRWVADRLPVSISETPNGVRAVHGSRFDGWWFGAANVRVSFFVQVPRDWEGEVSLETSNGRISAADLRGVARLRTSNGPVVVERLAGTVEIRTSNGRIEVKDAEGVVDAETSNGAIVVAGAVLAQTGRFRTSNGAVDLRARLAEGASYEVRTSNGEVRLVLIDPDVQLDVATSNGQIELETEVAATEIGRSRLAGRIGQGAARLSARTSNGDITVSAERKP